MKNILIVALCLAFITPALTACKTSVRTDEVKVKGTDYELEFGDEHHGDFCPPGQAKKGNC